MAQPTSNKARTSAKNLIKERRPAVDSGMAVFALNKGINLLISPKFTFIDSEGNRTHVRYAQDQNSIFVDEQVEIDPIKLSRIVLNEKTVIKDSLLMDFLLINPSFGKLYKLIDPAGEAKKEMDRVSKFDDVWDSVRQLSLENTKALNLLLNDVSLSQMANTTMPELRLSIRKIAEKDPERVQEAMADPVLETLYLYHMGIALDVIKYLPRREVVIWTDSQKELCKVPTNKEPSMFVARQLLTDDFLKARELLETKLND
jgi:hypothetical protein